jgi:hypothetical protein
MLNNPAQHVGERAGEEAVVLEPAQQTQIGRDGQDEDGLAPAGPGPAHELGGGLIDQRRHH